MRSTVYLGPIQRLTGLQLRTASAGYGGWQYASGHNNDYNSDYNSDYDNDHTSDNASETSGSSEAWWKRQWRTRDSGPENRVKRWIGSWENDHFLQHTTGVRRLSDEAVED